MKAAFVKNSSKIVVKDVKQPSIGPEEILVQMQACGICGSDVEKVFGQYSQPSMRLGHEPSGTIIKVGENVTRFKEGDRIFAHHHVPCYSCHFCKHGNETMCKKYYETNLDPCGLSEQFIVPGWNVQHGGVLKIPDSMSFEEASLIEPLACCMRAWTKFSYQKGDSVAILGVGPTGILHTILAKSKGSSNIFCTDVNDFRLDFAKKFGASFTINSKDTQLRQKVLFETENLGVDVAIVATGNLQAFKEAFHLVRKGGTIMLFGVPSKGAVMELDMSLFYSKEITMTSSYAASDHDTRVALEFLSTSKINIKELITHRYALEQTQMAFDRAHTGEHAMKIIITS